MSAIASTAPTSWKWIVSTGTLWIFASLSPSSSNVRIAVAFTGCGQ